MNGGKIARAFASRPGGADRWVKAPEPRPAGNTESDRFSARLTIDITPELRGRIKIVAFQRGVTVADMLRELLAREYPSKRGGTS